MEWQIIKRIDDITYKTELIPHHFLEKWAGIGRNIKFMSPTKSGGGLNSRKIIPKFRDYALI